jgi:hypothetical protein
MVAGTTARPRPILFRTGTQQSRGDLLRKVELWTGWIAAACRFEKIVSSAAFVLFGKEHTVPISRLCPHGGDFYPNAFRNLS